MMLILLMTLVNVNDTWVRALCIFDDVVYSITTVRMRVEMMGPGAGYSTASSLWLA